MKVLIVDDDLSVRAVLKAGLEREPGYQVVCVASGEQALATAYEHNPDVVLLDVMMAGMSGWDLCRQLRNVSDVPIIFVSAKSRESDIVMGLACGADDYITKPFGLAELKARLAAALRRVRSHNTHTRQRYDDGVLHIDLQDKVVRKGDRSISLTPKEFQLLACLVRNMGRVVPHVELLRKVWGPGYETERGYLALYVCYLRQKLEDDPKHPRYVCTRFRVGYYFRSAYDSSSVNGS
jgi:two-component system KDP operon response regulator KdpE